MDRIASVLPVGKRLRLWNTLYPRLAILGILMILQWLSISISALERGRREDREAPLAVSRFFPSPEYIYIETEPIRLISIPHRLSERCRLFNEPLDTEPVATFDRLNLCALIMMDERTRTDEGAGFRERNMANLQGRIALVTGASQGIGRACALELARAGATVALAARNEAKLAEVAAEIEVAGGQAATFALDIAAEESIKAVAKAVIERFGKVEILVNNAGITRDGLMMMMKRADWDDVLGTNLTGAFLLTQALIRPMIKNRWGRVINISSVVGRTGQAGQVNYAASKAGLIGMTRSIAREVGSRGITANAIAPGYIETPMTAVLDEKQLAAMMAAIPLGRAGTDADIAQAVAFLASDAASYITGQVLDVNGGMFMGG